MVHNQLPSLHHYIDLLGHKQLRVDGLEADDLISHAAERLLEQEEDIRVMVYSNDSDLWQLLEERLTLIQPTGQGGCMEVTVDHCIEKFEVRPGRIASLKALCGDTSDNYKPIPTFGPVKAVQAINAGVKPKLRTFAEHRSLDLPAPLLALLAENWDRVHTCFQLAKLPRTLNDPRIVGHQEQAAHALGLLSQRQRVMKKKDLDTRRENLLELMRKFSLDSQIGEVGRLFRDVKVQ
jgi:5'-3' exonuclease